jgi:hypothetical protein
LDHILVLRFNTWTTSLPNRESIRGREEMDEKKEELLKEIGYEVEDDVAKFLNLTPEDADRLEEMILKARLDWLMSR